MENYLLLIIFFGLFMVICESRQVGGSSKCTEEICKLPDCRCPSIKIPGGLSIDETPQIVLVTFDDVVNGSNVKYYRKLFNRTRRNPNGCPISGTFFAGNEWSDYKIINELYSNGHEIGAHGVLHRDSGTWWSKASYENWKKQLVGARNILSKKASIPEHEIRGVRAPFLAIGADRQYSVILNHHFEYDASIYPKFAQTRQPLWPYTLDYPLKNHVCNNKNCPKRKYPGMWEIPLNILKCPGGKLCSMTDECRVDILKTKEDALYYLRKNFRRFAQVRAPFGLFQHYYWFKNKHLFEAMDEFIGELNKMDDVWIISMHQLIEWMRNPNPISELDTFKPWKTSCLRKPAEKKLKIMNLRKPNIIKTVPKMVKRKMKLRTRTLSGKLRTTILKTKTPRTVKKMQKPMNYKPEVIKAVEPTKHKLPESNRRPVSVSRPYSILNNVMYNVENSEMGYHVIIVFLLVFSCMILMLQMGMKYLSIPRYF